VAQQWRDEKINKNQKDPELASQPGNLFYNTRGRCYDHNFLRFVPIFGEKIGVFLKNQSYDKIFA
jgi:hypothetical protein